MHLVAEYPLGTYAGRSRSGRLEHVPSPDRLLAALLAAAGSGTRAIVDGDRLAPRPEDVEILEWFEQHPPDAVTMPDYLLPDPRQGVTAYRKQGTRAKGRDAPAKGSRALERSALDGPVAWTWESFPEAFESALADLVQDVAYLGPSDSPVILRLASDPPKGRLWVREVNANPFMVREHVALPSPLPGRTRGWMNAHDKRMKVPKRDSLAKSEGPIVDGWVAGAQPILFVPEQEQVSGRVLPWGLCLVLQARERRGTVTPQAVNRVTVGMHRAIVSVLGADGNNVDSWITGRFLEGTDRPANHVAIHWVPRSDKVAFDWVEGATGAVVLMLPHDLPDSSLAALTRAVAAIRGRGLNVRRSLGLEVLDVATIPSERFWSAPEAGHSRHWVTWPAAVAERVRRNTDFQDVFTHSVRNVWRDLPHDRTCVRVQSAKRITQGGAQYVHRMNPEALRVVYRAHVEMGPLMEPGDLIAVGQARHLGSGLLVPLDVAEEL